MIPFLAALFALAGFDAWFTARQFRKFGTKIELNNVVRWLANHVGITQGVVAGIVVPSLIECALFYAFNAKLLAVLRVGMRLTLALHQLKYLHSFSKKVELLNK